MLVNKEVKKNKKFISELFSELLSYYGANIAQENRLVTSITSYKHGAYKENRYGYCTD